MLLKKIPTRLNLRSRGISSIPVLCPLCNANEESVDQLFINCYKITEIWRWLFSWCNIQMTEQSTVELVFFNLVDNGQTDDKRRFLEAAFGVVIWCIWKGRNLVVFKNGNFLASSVIAYCQVNLFNWMKYRSNVKSLDWCMWCCNPLHVL